MLAFLGLLTILLLLFLVITKKASPIIALTLIPIGTGIISGNATEIPTWIGEGLQTIAPTGVMFVFAILFFGILMDAGTFQPIIAGILRAAGHDPIKIALATALLSMLVHLDGSGAVTFLIVIPALAPIYDQMGMNRLTLASIVAISAGTMNMLPWGGPTIRAASALNVTVTELFNPMILPLIAGLITVFFIAFYLGKKEKANLESGLFEPLKSQTQIQESINRPKLFWVNILLILVAVISIILSWAPPFVVFMIAFALALLINFPKVEDQKQRIDAHAKEAMLMAGILFAAGCFTGILKGSGMMESMAATVQGILPE